MDVVEHISSDHRDFIYHDRIDRFYHIITKLFFTLLPGFVKCYGRAKSTETMDSLSSDIERSNSSRSEYDYLFFSCFQKMTKKCRLTSTSFSSQKKMRLTRLHDIQCFLCNTIKFHVYQDEKDKTVEYIVSLCYIFTHHFLHLFDQSNTKANIDIYDIKRKKSKTIFATTQTMTTNVLDAHLIEYQHSTDYLSEQFQALIATALADKDNLSINHALSTRTSFRGDRWMA